MNLWFPETLLPTFYLTVDWAAGEEELKTKKQKNKQKKIYFLTLSDNCMVQDGLTILSYLETVLPCL